MSQPAQQLPSKSLGQHIVDSTAECAQTDAFDELASSGNTSLDSQTLAIAQRQAAMSIPAALDRESKHVDFTEQYDTSTLKDQNVLITGGATGIGRGCATALAEAGAYVTIADVNEKDANEAVEQLKSKGLKAQFVNTDVSNWSSQVGAFKSALAFGPNKTIDIVIPAAGIGGTYLKHWLDNEEPDENGDPQPVNRKVIDINYLGVYDTAHLAIWYANRYPGPKENDKQIILIASMAGYSSMNGVPGYGSSKWGVRGLFRAIRGLQKILGDDKPVLKVNLLAPGYIRTPMTKNLWGLADKGQMAMGDVEDVVDVAMRMAADPRVIGRAATIFGAGSKYDLGDDPAGLESGEVLRGIFQRRAPPANVNQTQAAKAVESAWHANKGDKSVEVTEKAKATEDSLTAS